MIKSYLNSLSVIIPVHNEEKRIRPCLTRVQDYLELNNADYEIIVAEDGSSDRTVEIAQEYARFNNKIRINSSKERLGKGGSILKAIMNATKDNLMYIDVDMASDISEIERMLLFIDAYDIVVGSRLIRENLGRIKRPLSRKLFSNCYSLVCKALFNASINDFQCGIKLMKRNPTLILDVIPEIKTNNFAFDTDLLVKSLRHGLKIKEVAVQWEHKEGSKINVPKQIWFMGKDLLTIWMDIHFGRFKNVGRLIHTYSVPNPIITNSNPLS